LLLKFSASFRHDFGGPIKSSAEDFEFITDNKPSCVDTQGTFHATIGSEVDGDFSPILGDESLDGISIVFSIAVDIEFSYETEANFAAWLPSWRVDSVAAKNGVCASVWKDASASEVIGLLIDFNYFDASFRLGVCCAVRFVI
jgi:hypothetical protein